MLNIKETATSDSH